MARTDRGHWGAVKAAFEADAAAREADAARMTAEERVVLGLRMGAAAPRTAATELELQRLASEQGLLHARWRFLQARRGGER